VRKFNHLSPLHFLMQYVAIRYPAGHVRVHQFLYDITDSGTNVAFAQWIYSVLYIASLFLSCIIYQLAGNVPNWAILLLPLSKRLHSIYVLRLFNDCWAVVAVQASIVAFQRGYFDTGMMLFRCVPCFVVPSVF